MTTRSATIALLTAMAAWAQTPAARRIRIELIGDSTQTDNVGYGRGFCANLTPEIDCVNMARGGASTKTFRELGLWDKAIASQSDYMLIQFGHNDAVTPEHLDRQVPLPQYQENLKRFIDEARAAGATPILVTPLSRRYFGPDGKIHSDLEGIGKTVPSLAKYVRTYAAQLPPQGVKAMKVYEGGPTKIVLVGDSTVAEEGAWGPGFCAVLTANVTCVNEARNGRSSKSYYDEGLWKKALADRGDYYLIQFGHNDQPGKGPERETDPNTTFAGNLRRYIAQTREIGAVPVIVTALSRRTFKEGKVVEDLNAYAAAARRVAEEENVTLIDLNRLSTALLNSMTQEQADRFDADVHPDAKAENQPEAKHDRTHLNSEGKKVFGRMVAGELMRRQVELGPDVIREMR